MNVHKILLVDDDEDYYELFRDILQELNPDVNVVYVNDACDIDDFLKPPFPDIIILDIRMPKMDGIECLKKIRANKELEKSFGDNELYY